MDKKTFVEGLEPVIRPESKVLILGTMPGELSLTLKQYYSDPRNQFWKLMNNLINGISSVSYEEKILMLNDHAIALWDVIGKCEREGSLDSNIEKTKLVINDFQPLFDKYKNLRAVFCNGKSKKSSYKLFKKYVMPDLSPKTKGSLNLIALPSSSSANTHQNLGEKSKDWIKIKEHLT